VRGGRTGRRDITLIAVTKTRPASDVRLLSELGWPTSARTVTPRPRRRPLSVPTWISLAFYRQLQTNKCASVVRYASVVHSVDRLRLIRALAGRPPRRRVISSLIEVSLDGDRPGRRPAGR